ncbi:uncharacterized protein LOC117942071 [Xyrichtys novacula]|uniref:Uncharacterized protein LOC117942071 n=1 Tax=Xyrichtys novacula TaxID=13765 RepID=A0AAV1FWP8_XYRNO|nr:uncharacterized protein LOC117942071 [Xyrichtys novacula]
MMISVCFTLLFFWTTQDFVTCVGTEMPVDFLSVGLGESITLNCTYDCSSGFVRGCWSKSSDISGCHWTLTQCSVSLHLSNVSTEDLKTNYTCYTMATDDTRLLHKTQRIVVLQLQDQSMVPSWTTTQRTETKIASKPNNANGGEFTGTKVLATVTVTVAMVLAALAAYLCLTRSRQSWNCKEEPFGSRSGSPLPPEAAHPTMKGPQSAQSERVTLRIPTPDNEEDTEVPYADIMITVRGVSTPELTQVGYQNHDGQKEWWGEEPRSHLQASRSADRLNIPQPREISRKMSTNSEYAVITYA